MADIRFIDLDEVATVGDDYFIPIDSATDGAQKIKPENLGVSTATQTALDLKANTTDLGTAAAADTTDFATAAQGATADSALQADDIGVSVQAYDADLTDYAGKTAPTGGVVGTTDEQTLTNKSISGASNTLSNIANASLVNSSMTIAGHSVSLGGTQAIAAADLSNGATGTGAVVLASGATLTDPIVGTQTAGDNSTKAASTAFVQGAIAASGGGDLLSTNNLSDLADPAEALDNLGITDLSMVPVASSVQATEVADFANGKYWLNGRNYPSLLAWLQAGDSSFKRDSVAVKLDKSGRLSEIGTDVPRLIYDGSGDALGLLLEGTITNRVSDRQSLTAGTWTKGKSTVAATTAITAPDGSLGAFKLTEDATAGLHYVSQNITVPADTRCAASIFVHAGTRTKGRLWFVQTNGFYVNFDLTAGTVGTATSYGTGTAIGAYIVPYPNGWYRIVIMGTLASGQTTAYLEIDLNDASGNDSYTGDGASYFYVWGPQLEAVGVATSPILSTSTRNKELLTRYLPEQPAEWTKIFKARTAKFAPAAYQVLWHNDDGTEANDFEVWRDSSRHLQVEVHYNGTDQGTIDMGVVADDTDFVLAVRGTATEMAASLNGGAVVKLTVTMPSTMTVERYGTNVSPETREWSSTIAYQATIPVAASDSELIALSS